MSIRRVGETEEERTLKWKKEQEAFLCRPKAKNLALLYEYYAKESGKTSEEIVHTIQLLEGKAEGVDVENEVKRLNNDLSGRRVVTPNGKGVLAGLKDGKYQVKTADGLKIFSEDQLQFLNPLAGAQDAIDSLQKQTTDQVKEFLGPEKLKELEPTPRVSRPPLKADTSFPGQVLFKEPTSQPPISESSSSKGACQVKSDGGEIMNEWLKWFVLGASLILFAGIVFYLVVPKWKMDSAGRWKINTITGTTVRVQTHL